MSVKRLFQSSAGPLYVEVDYDGVRVLLFGDDGTVQKATDITGDLKEQLAPALRETLGAGEPDLPQLTADLQEAVAAMIVGLVFLLLWIV